MPILQAAHVPAQLFLDAFCCAVKGNMRVLCLAAAFEDKALHDMQTMSLVKPSCGARPKVACDERALEKYFSAMDPSRVSTWVWSASPVST
jgi:hypothetical protein